MCRRHPDLLLRGLRNRENHFAYTLLDISQELLTPLPPKEQVPHFHRDADEMLHFVLRAERRERELEKVMHQQAAMAHEFDTNPLLGVLLRRLDGIERRLTELEAP